MVGQRGVGGEVVDGLLTGPAVFVQAGVDHQTRGAPHLERQPAEVVIRRLVDAHQRAEPFGIQAPAFAIAGEIGLLAEVRTRRRFQCQCGLEAVARCALVHHQRRQVVQRPRRQVVGVEQARIQTAAARGVDRRDFIRHRQDGEAVTRQRADHVLEFAIHLLGDPRGVRQQFLRRLRIELRIGAQELQELREAALETGPGHHLAHFRIDARHFGQADVVYLLCRHVTGDELADLGLVELATIGKIAGAGGGARTHQVLPAHEGQQVGVGRHHFLQHRLASFLTQLAADRFGNRAGNAVEG
ncbi:hypothetical protein D3C81_721140 [compost metagenome]